MRDCVIVWVALMSSVACSNAPSDTSPDTGAPDAGGPEAKARDASDPPNPLATPSNPPPPIPAASHCAADGWCWIDPMPTGETVFAMWASSPTDVWLVGSGGLVFHFDGASWSFIECDPLEGWFKSVWSSSSSDAWLIGWNGAFHWDGTKCSAPNNIAGDGSNVWGSSPTDVWLSNRLSLFHFDGATWSKPNVLGGCASEQITGSDSTNAWTFPATCAWDGTSWTQATPVSKGTMFTAWSRRWFDVWGIVTPAYNTADPPTVEHWDGTSWSSALTLATTGAGGIVVPARDDVWVSADSLLHLESGTWVTKSSQHLNHLASSAPNDVWGQQNLSILHWNGTTLAPTGSDVKRVTTSNTNLDGTGPNDVWFVGVSGSIAHWDGSTLSSVPNITTKDLTSVYAVSPSEVWVSGTEVLLHWQGGVWTPVTPVAFDPGTSIAVSGSGAKDVWILGAQLGKAQHFDGSTWTTYPAAGAWGTIRAISPTDAWTRGPALPSTTLMHWDGIAWTATQINDIKTVHDIWARNKDDVWVSGDAGLDHFDGQTWQSVPQFSGDIVEGLTGNATTLWAYVPGQPDSYARWDGQAWIRDRVALFDGKSWANASELWAASSSGIVRKKLVP